MRAIKYICACIYKVYELVKKTIFDIKMEQFFLAHGVDVYRTFRISSTTKIYADSKLVIGKGLTTNNNCVIDSNDSFGIFIGENLLLAPDVFIRAGNHDYSYFEDAFQEHGHCAKKIEYNEEIYSIVIEDNVWIGRGATIISGAHIGKGSVIGAGAVVKEPIPEYSIVIGNPAKVVSNRKKTKSFCDRDDIGLFD